MGASRGPAAAEMPVNFYTMSCESIRSVHYICARVRSTAGLVMTLLCMAERLQMRNMSPEDMANMQGTAMAMQGGGGSAAFASPAENLLTSSSSGTDSAAALAASSAGAMPSFPGMPAGMPAMTPEMMSMATKMMAGMRPEDMAAMQAMASGGAAPGPGGMPDMSHLMTNPQMMVRQCTSLPYAC